MKIKGFIERLENWLAGTKDDYIRNESSYYIKDEKRIEETIRKNHKNIKLVLICMVLMTLLLFLKGLLGDDRVVYDGNGNPIMIQRQSLNESETIEIGLETGNTKKTVTLSFIAKDKETEPKTLEEKDEEYYISQLISAITSSNEKTITLPKTLANGKNVKWKKPVDNTPFLIAFLCIIIALLFRQSRYGNLNKYKKACMDSIIKSLPSYINRILLIWKSGSTFRDAMEKATINSNGSDFFSIEIRELLEKSQISGQNFIRLFNDFARLSGVKELKKLGNIIVENQDKGSFLLDKLERERETMWEVRKKKALEDGKRAETKMVIPMTILLMALIMVTAAPAFLVM